MNIWFPHSGNFSSFLSILRFPVRMKRIIIDNVVAKVFFPLSIAMYVWWYLVGTGRQMQFNICHWHRNRSNLTISWWTWDCGPRIGILFVLVWMCMDWDVMWCDSIQIYLPFRRIQDFELKLYFYFKAAFFSFDIEKHQLDWKRYRIKKKKKFLPTLTLNSRVRRKSNIYFAFDQL